ncbi:MAG: peptidylprolyl isomerase [Fimbriimonadaceae bacterium]|nr:peptidylprolyl isomerase [Fimbriimonadaceae bacterium]QYK56955.1 MAG: peptidylprolyl isomerase [Fimbriimonadaceae bacterium]
MTRTLLLAVLAFVFAALVAVGCTSEPAADSSGSTTTTGTTSEHAGETEKADPEKTEPEKEGAKPLATAPKDGDEVGVIETQAGRIVVMFHPDRAPNTVTNFKELARKGVYNGTRFHRVIPDFMIQGGDPLSKDLSQADKWGTGGTDMIKDETNDIKHVPGVLSMAKTAAPDTGSSQFFIMVGTSENLDGVHTAFGQVVQGMDVVTKIVDQTGTQVNNGMVEPAKAIVVKSIKIEKWPIK